MSVWHETVPGGASLSSREGALVVVCVKVDPRDLELLLEALARIGFPVNPQIYHDATVVSVQADGSSATEAATLVEFPAYESRLGEVQQALAAYAFDPADMQVIAMLDAIRGAEAQERSSASAGGAVHWLVKQRSATTVH